MAIASQIKEGRKRIQWEHRRKNWKREFSGSTEERTGKRIQWEHRRENWKENTEGDRKKEFQGLALSMWSLLLGCSIHIQNSVCTCTFIQNSLLFAVTT